MKNFMDYISGNELTLVDFYAVWCAQCKHTHNVLEEYKKLTGGSVRVLKLDIDAPANIAKIKEYNITSIPSIMFFRDGKALWRGSGMISAAHLKEISDNL